MNVAIQPKTYLTEITCTCGAQYQIEGTAQELHVEICATCHPFYTGQLKLVDSSGRVNAFAKKLSKKQENPSNKKQRRLEKIQAKLQEDLSRPETLAQIRKAFK